MQPYMSLDAYGKYTICNIYYDTDTYEVIRSSIEKPTYKEKLRIRSYGVATSNSMVFIELKKKVGGIVYKRRIELPYPFVDAYLSGLYHPKNSQIAKEIDWFLAWYQPTQKTFIAYERMAYFGKQEEQLRITFDFAIRWRKDHVCLADGDHGEKLLKKDEVLMEIKLPNAMPLWLSSCLNKLEIYPVSFSKYGTCYKEKLFETLLIGG